jgi:UDP-N-acetylglucosamine--N-acetylmuramyl-(pentapeptide) pyrophosphoryl-undecaprenol N-acetylglucosamine transferase
VVEGKPLFEVQLSTMEPAGGTTSERAMTEVQRDGTGGSRPRILFVASAGGHLAELDRLARRWSPGASSVWLTFDTEQSRSLVHGRNHVFVPYVAPRDLRGTIRSFFLVRRLLKREQFDEVVSTGSAVAVGAFAAARLRSVPTTYVESVARFAGPSMTGRLVHSLRLARTLLTQHASWAAGPWTPVAGVLSEYERRPSGRASSSRPLKVVVTLGTIRPYRFDALVDAVLATGLANEDTVWQLGATDRRGLPGHVVAELSRNDLLDAVADADVVICHAGVGTILDLLERGVHPVVVPRRQARAEHVDDHQYEIAEYLADHGVVTVVDAERLTAMHLREAAAVETSRRA